MRPLSYLITGITLLTLAAAGIASPTQAASGKIYLQVESHGEAWYVNPDDARRYYLGRPDDAFRIMQYLGVGITNANLKLIPTAKQTWDGDSAVMSAVRGKIVLQVENNGEAWYVNPTSGKRHYLGTPTDAFALMTQFGEGITTEHLQQIEPNIAFTRIQAVGGVTQEYVELKNFGPFAEDISNWYIANGNDRKLQFKDDTILEPGDTIIMQRRASQEPLWDDTSGTAYLYGPHDTLIDRSIYTTAERVVLDVPFTTQAPTGNWSLPFAEACEEAIIVMLQQYYAHQGMPAASEVESKIYALVDWELARFGHHQDTSAGETAQTLRHYAGLSVEVSDVVTIDALKQALSAGHPVVVPVYGKALGNPHYLNGGPYYHMVLLVGYDGNNFITHDPGTRYGEFYYFDATTLVNAIHDLTSPESNMASGTPRVVIIENEL